VAWSTRETAELAGTTVRAVRHYHQIGLLDELARRRHPHVQNLLVEHPERSPDLRQDRPGSCRLAIFARLS
jgi:hypothetical protein